MEDRTRDDRPMWLIWSNEHGRWWRPAHAGYTAEIGEAGRYPKHIADRICADARLSGRENEVAIIAPEAYAALHGPAPRFATDGERSSWEIAESFRIGRQLIERNSAHQPEDDAFASTFAMLTGAMARIAVDARGHADVGSLMPLILNGVMTMAIRAQMDDEDGD